jgi:hypothetical protein
VVIVQLFAHSPWGTHIRLIWLNAAFVHISPDEFAIVILDYERHDSSVFGGGQRGKAGE